MKATKFSLAFIGFCLMFLTSLSAQAQAARVPPIPANAPRASLEMLEDGFVLLNGDPYKTSAAIQIRDTNNYIVSPASLTRGIKYHSRIYLDQSGMLWRAWILSDVEQDQPAPRFRP